MSNFTMSLIEEARKFYKEPAVENYLSLALVTWDLPSLGKKQFAAFCKEASEKVLRNEYQSFAQIQNELDALV